GTEVEFRAVQADFAEAPRWLREQGIAQVDGVVADLGVSSMQLDRAERGFSFAAPGPLDMRMDPRQSLTAEQVVNQFDERTLADLIFQFGEERRSRRISRAIVRSRPLRSTAQLADLVAAVNRPMKSSGRRGMHPATRTFQALRIYVNSEMESLSQLLAALPGWLKPEGRAVIISFHSLEDRPVKQAFRAGAQSGQWRLLTPGALRPTDEETAHNPRSRSAKLRAIERAAYREAAMEIYFRQQIDNSRVRRLADPRRRREQRLSLLAGGVLFLLLFGYAWMRFQTVRLGYQ